MSSQRLQLRVQSRDGCKRIEAFPSDTTTELFEKVHDLLGYSSFEFTLHGGQDRKTAKEIISSRSKTVASLGLQNGYSLFVTDTKSSATSNNAEAGPSSRRERLDSVGTVNVIAHSKSKVEEDLIDVQLWGQDGKIQRARDDKLCRHGNNGRCIHCSPLEPYNETYLKEHNIKHLSFHSYLRKLTAGVDRGKFVSLEDLNCKIRPGCKDHPPWPQGICSKCQPSAITLNRQSYRHVDNVMFENASLVERFLNYWRTTGHQRVGFLYGHCEGHTDVPLGIRATVAAIYEPPQESSRDQVKLLPDERKPIVDALANELGLQCVGWIFTDLIADDMKKGTVKHCRNIESHFLSAQECITAGHFQNEHPNPCRFSPSGYFGSKFVTVCVTGDSSNQVHMEGYSVSNQCMALVRDNCLVPTKDAPELGYIRNSTPTQYVPDVFYKETDSYGNEVSRMARPLPVEYLLVDVPASTPLTPQFTFLANSSPLNLRPFPVENRLVDGHIQDFTALCAYMQQFGLTGEGNEEDEEVRSKLFLTAISDFHLLLFIATMDTLPLREYMGPLLNAVRENDAGLAWQWSRSEHWATVEQLMIASASSPSVSPLASSAAAAMPHSASMSSISDIAPQVPPMPNSAQPWTCNYCTFVNQPVRSSCEMCNLPR